MKKSLIQTRFGLMRVDFFLCIVARPFRDVGSPPQAQKIPASEDAGYNSFCGQSGDKNQR
jgi:hypothetical protein